jgi:hypothetical protein
VHSTHLSLERADQQALEDLSRFIAVSYILECLGCVLATDINQHLFATSALESVKHTQRTNAK